LNPNITIRGLERDWNNAKVLKSVTEEEDWFVLGKLRQQHSSGVSDEVVAKVSILRRGRLVRKCRKLCLVFRNSIKSMWVWGKIVAPKGNYFEEQWQIVLEM